MILRVKLSGALYRLSMDACHGQNKTLNNAIIRLLEHPEWLEQVVDDLASDTALDVGDIKGC
jgi:hypothetical protein|tara:strand:- start:103 stop:288 length:186 start_codon:yes stop_codon:yes gene_type:complete